MIYFSNSTRRRVNVRGLKRAAVALLRSAGQDGATLSLSLVGDRAMRGLNRAHRGKDRPTDVLSFPLLEKSRVRREHRGGVERMLGDVVISLDTAGRQAASYDATLDREVLRLLVHGILHLIGHDHERPAERLRMEREERKLAAAIGLPWAFEEEG